MRKNCYFEPKLTQLKPKIPVLLFAVLDFVSNVQRIARETCTCLFWHAKFTKILQVSFICGQKHIFLKQNLQIEFKAQKAACFFPPFVNNRLKRFTKCTFYAPMPALTNLMSHGDGAKRSNAKRSKKDFGRFSYYYLLVPLEEHSLNGPPMKRLNMNRFRGISRSWPFRVQHSNFLSTFFSSTFLLFERPTFTNGPESCFILPSFLKNGK